MSLGYHVKSLTLLACIEARLTSLRHAGLDPASRFFFNAASQGSWTPDQVRGDGNGVLA